MTNSEQTERTSGTTATETAAQIDVPAIEADIARALTHSSEPWDYADLATMRDQLARHVELLLPATERAAERLHQVSLTRQTLAVRLEAARAQIGHTLAPDGDQALHQVRQLAITSRLLLAEHKRSQR